MLELFLIANSLVLAYLWYDLNKKYSTLVKEHADLLARRSGQPVEVDTEGGAPD